MANRKNKTIPKLAYQESERLQDREMDVSAAYDTLFTEIVKRRKELSTNCEKEQN